MEPGDITQLLRRIEEGDAQAAERILPLVYGELRKLAAAKMARESAVMTLQPTALVHEAWLRLGGDRQADWKSRAHFFSAAAEAMRRILIENARRRHAVRHGAGLEKLSASLTGFDVAAPQLSDAELLLLNEAMENLAAHDARKAEIVKQWYFVGLTREEVAEVMGISVRTVERDWIYARAWLMAEMDRLRSS
jgi:RNA polymerase sigma factor (TIGR02999 family)